MNSLEGHRANASVAGALALEWRRCWDFFASQLTDADRVEAGTRAHCLFELVKPVLALAPEGEDVRLGEAAGCLMEIAEGYALVSHTWADGEREWLSLPEEKTLGRLVRRLGVDEWCSALGHSLELADRPRAARAYVEETNVDEGHQALLLRTAIRGYVQLLDTVESVDGRARVYTDRLSAREYACRELDSARRHRLYLLACEGAEILVRGCAARAIIADSWFLVGHAASVDAVAQAPLLGREALGVYLDDLGLRDWLLDQADEG